MASRIADHRDDCFGAGQGAQRAPTLMTCWSGLFQPSGLKTREATTRDQSLAKDTVNDRHLYDETNANPKNNLRVVFKVYNIPCIPVPKNKIESVTES